MKQNYIFLNDIPYGNHERQKVDIFIPEKPKSDSGLILFIHGGGWSDGDKSGHHVDTKHFCNLGYICAAMNYRFVTNEISIFDELDDITSAMKKIKETCSQHGYNIDKSVLSGGSAGGHLSVMYAYTRKDEAPVKPVAACVWCPPVNCYSPDFLLGISGEFESWKYEILSKCCGYKLTKDTFLSPDEQAALKRISPKEYVSPDCVPTAVFQGKHDELVPYEHIIDFLAMLENAEVRNSLLVYENSGHALKDDPETAEKSKEIINEYAEKYF